MPAEYLLRFDDLCPTTNWAVWDDVERALDRHGLRPLVAVVPDNLDEQLAAGPAEPAFWERVRAWQRRGWAIGLHGYQHRYSVNTGGLLGIHTRSEFAGLDAATQGAKLDAGLAIFAREGVRADAWVAPGHSFDVTTLRELQRRSLDVVSDGFFVRAGHTRDGVTWVPQQMWRLRWQPAGTWTVCYHANSWTPQQLAAFITDLERFAHRITTFAEVLDRARQVRLTGGDRLAAEALRGAVLGKRVVGRVASKTRAATGALR